MNALEEYNAEVQRIGKEYQPRDWNDGANSIKHLADAMRDELLARIEELTKQRDAANKWRDRAEAKYDSLCATMPWDVRYWHDKALKREDDRFRALDLARARGEQRDEYQALYAAEKQRADEAEAALAKTEQALFAANCMLRDLGVHPATLESE